LSTFIAPYLRVLSHPPPYMRHRSPHVAAVLQPRYGRRSNLSAAH